MKRNWLKNKIYTHFWLLMQFHSILKTDHITILDIILNNNRVLSEKKNALNDINLINDLNNLKTIYRTVDGKDKKEKKKKGLF